MHTQRSDGAVFLWNLLVFLIRSAWDEIFLGLCKYLDAHAILVVIPSTYTLHVDMPPVSLATYLRCTSNEEIHMFYLL